MDDKPLEILPFGDSIEAQAKRAKGFKGGLHGCLFLMALFAFFAVFAFGWMTGHAGLG